MCSSAIRALVCENVYDCKFCSLNRGLGYSVRSSICFIFSFMSSTIAASDLGVGSVRVNLLILFAILRARWSFVVLKLKAWNFQGADLEVEMNLFAASLTTMFHLCHCLFSTSSSVIGVSLFNLSSVMQLLI